MSAICPAGHASATTDYCDVCGARMESSGVAVAPPDAVADPGVDTSATPVSAPCPQCGTPRAGRDRFCEDCGFDFVAGVPAAADEPSERVAAPAAWSAVVAADPEYFAGLAPEGLSFPADAPERAVPLDASPVRIGRTRSDGGAAPEIELSDPAVSRVHATLLRGDDGSWSVVDEGSSNGTTINGDPDPIAPHVPVALADGDRVHVGAWTTITLARTALASPLRSRAA